MQQMAELMEVFRNSGVKQTFKKGDFIIHPGEAPPGVFYIYSGVVKAYDITKYGEENLLSIRKDEEIFPLIWALTGQERHIIFQALAPTTTWMISYETFQKYLRSHPTAMAAMAGTAASAGPLCTYGLLNKPSDYAEFGLRVLLARAKAKPNG